MRRIAAAAPTSGEPYMALKRHPPPTLDPSLPGNELGSLKPHSVIFSKERIIGFLDHGTTKKALERLQAFLPSSALPQAEDAVRVCNGLMNTLRALESGYTERVRKKPAGLFVQDLLVKAQRDTFPANAYEILRDIGFELSQQLEDACPGFALNSTYLHADLATIKGEVEGEIGAENMPLFIAIRDQYRVLTAVDKYLRAQYEIPSENLR